MDMNIKIKIVRIFPKDNNKATPLQKNKFKDRLNKFEEIVLFLDCPTVQTIIKNFRKRIKIRETIPYKEFDEWKERSIIDDELSREEKSFLYDLNYDIDYLSNRAKAFEELSKEQEEELEQKSKEVSRWLDPYYTFTRALEKKLKSLETDKFLQVLIKAIVCGEVRNKDLSDELVKRKGAKTAIFIQRQLFWQYDSIQFKKGTKIGYGSIGKQVNKNLRSVISDINSYKNKLKNYESTLVNNT